ncbi:hypothetical protein [Xanthomonas campestris]|uniref:hypothetical protein n=1 Tax=Xanthomonas TaxID=338 RepID=UPI0023E94F41|nr:hypothetical protein [Xanthomonas campestris]MCW1978682.1 hypothetical protein [Xanthomonas campestris]MDM7696035.1 hypothetical protein [Xanthomonas campestris pv. campestris]
MTSLALLAVLLAAGWYFYRQWRYTRFEALHHPGHPQYFGAALCAVYLFGMSTGLHALAARHPFYLEYLGKLLAMLPLQVGEKQTSAGLALHLALTLWCLLLAAVLPILLNDPLVRIRSLAQLVAFRLGAIDAVEGLAIKCEEDGTLVALTLDSGKVYAGILDEFNGPRVGKDWVAMTPVASGYRDDTGSLSLTTFYDIKLPEDTSFEIFKIIVSMKQIVSAQAFDLELYKQFQQAAAGQQDASSVAGGGSALERKSSVVAVTRHYFYLGLPIFLFLAPFMALKSTVLGLLAVVVAGFSSIAAESLRQRPNAKQVLETVPSPQTEGCAAPGQVGAPGGATLADDEPRR